MVNIFRSLRSKYKFPYTKTTKSLVTRKVHNTQHIDQIFDYWKTAAKHKWPQMPWYYGTGLHWSSLYPAVKTQQLCGNWTKNKDYNNSLLFDLPVCENLLANIGPFTMVRSKITCLDSQLQPKDFNINLKSLWHRDEKPHEVLRVIVPLQTSSEYLFEIENHRPLTLETGYFYAFDQSQWHRVYSSSRSPIPRIHLILSFVTWFDKIDGKWLPNYYCGKHDPLDLFDLISI